MSASANSLTLLLSELNRGNKNVINEIFPLVYSELKIIASRYLYQEYGERTIQTTELVHEAYLKIMGGNSILPENRSHFFGIAANAMRQLLVDFSRKKNAAKRGGGNQTRISLVDGILVYNEYHDKIIDIDEALKKLFLLDEDLSRIVELRFFGGLNIEETAKVLGCSAATVKRDWNFAKAWLLREIGDK